MPPKQDFSLREIHPNIDGGKTLIPNMLTLVEPLYFAYVRVVRASHLPVNQATGTCAPYVEVKTGNYKATTKYIQGTLAPVWNQVFAFNKDRLQSETIEILVRDKASVANEIIGRIEAGVGDIRTRLQGDSSVAPQWYGLEDKNGVSGRSGNLMLAIWVGDQVDDAFSVAWHLDAASVSVDKVSNARPQVYYSPRLWYLKIKVSGAQDLVVSDPNRKPEVYVKATLGNKGGVLSPYGVGEEPMEKFSSKLRATVYLDGVYHVFDEPALFSTDLTAPSPKLKPGKVGDLELGILKAEGLVAMKSKNGLKTTDAYCVAKYGPKWTRTSTVVSSLEPKWMKQYQWDVFDPCTVIAVGVFDNNNLQAGEGWAADRLIGKVIRIRLSTLEFGRIYKYAYPLVALMPGGVQKMGELHFTLRFIYTKSSGDKIYQYTQPMLPKSTYTNPMSVYQIEGLRNQAVRHVAMRLARAEPPLRREVVESMLSGRGPVWSIRRGKANFQRVMECLKCFKTALIWLDDLRQWKNSTTTTVMFAAFSVFVYHSEIVFPSFFAFLFFKALLNYFKRPRDILCLDTSLSQVESVNASDWQEELDTFPSSAPFEDLRLRYDRLRAIGYRIEETVGDLATQLERFHAVFSWRDRRATLIFTLFCLVAWIVFYLVPFRLLFFLFGTYLIRSPRFRVTLPPIPQNVFRRLPSRDDCLL
ncbi:FT-interacting protein [Salix suchowensis]|nr:FT-interacting protein [Salix suchowensis]